MQGAPKKILVKKDFVYDSDPDPTNSCVFKDGEKYYRIHSALVSEETEHLQAIYEIRTAVQITVKDRPCETLWVPA